MLIIAILTSAFTTKMKEWQREKTEGEKERMRANLLRAVSHDLRTPLTTIYGASSSIVMNYEKLTDEQKLQMANGIKEDSEWLIRMVENLLSITRIDSGGVKLLKSPTVLEELIDSVILKFKKRYPEQKVQLDIPDEVIVIPMDAILIEQVIINILENAVHHAKGFTRLGLRVFKIDEKAMAHMEAIIRSMTLKERTKPDIINSSRKKRIAAGSGRRVEEVNKLLKQFEQTKQMMKQLTSGKAKKRFKMPF